MFYFIEQPSLIIHNVMVHFKSCAFVMDKMKDPVLKDAHEHAHTHTLIQVVDIRQNVFFLPAAVS